MSGFSRSPLASVQRQLPFDRLIVDVAAWNERSVEVMGTKPKSWLQSPGGDRWLFKEVQSNPRRDGSRYLRGDDWAEVVATDLARAIGLSTAEVELAAKGGTRGVISRSIVPRGAALVHGNELLSGRIPGYENRRAEQRYTVTNSLDVVSDAEPPPGMYLSAQSAFSGFLLLDAVVGNSDRHHENWALLRRPRQNLQLAPTFDHASSMGFLLSDEERRDRLVGRDDNRTVETYARRTPTPFKDASSPTGAAFIAMASLPPRDRARWRGSLLSLDDVFEDSLGMVPSTRMSEVARSFAGRLISLNRKRLLDEWRDAE